jgi:predicted dehydrogenase
MSEITSPLRVAIVGCGNIATAYKLAILNHPDYLKLVGFNDIDSSRAENLANDIGATVYPTLEDVLADEQVELIVNLTVHHAHVETITRCLEAGKHVYTEKPLALDANDARALNALAESKGLRLASAPITFLGDAQQEAMRIVREGTLGQVRMVYADMNWNRIESWHPAPKPFFDVGAMFDVGVYPLTILTALFGSVKQVQAFGGQLMPERHTTAGEPFHFTSPDWFCALLDFENGVRCRITTSFYTGPTRQGGIEFHGDDATLHLASESAFDSALSIRARDTAEWTDHAFEKTTEGVDWARGLADLSSAIRNRHAHKASAIRAAHVVDIAASVHQSIATNGAQIQLSSRAE